MIKGAKKIIRNKTILHLDRFTADAGDLVTVVGESGAGKSKKYVIEYIRIE